MQLDTISRDELISKRNVLTNKANNVVVSSALVCLSVFVLLGIFTWSKFGLVCYAISGVVLGVLHGMLRKDDLQVQIFLLNYLLEPRQPKENPVDSVVQQPEKEQVPEKEQTVASTQVVPRSEEPSSEPSSTAADKPVNVETTEKEASNKKEEAGSKVVVKKRKAK